MADPRFNHPDFGKREEDWPDLDIDSGDEDYEAKLELAEAAFDASIQRRIAQRHHRPEFAHVPHELYAKAADHQDQLTPDERALLASRGDMVGKVLGYPDSLTPEEIHAFLLWAPPDVTRANIQRVTNGSLSTPADLFARAKEAIDRGDLETSLSEEAIMLPARGFYALDDPNYDGTATLAATQIPAYTKATGMIRKRLGLDPTVVYASVMFTMRVNKRKRGKEAEWDDFLRSVNEQEKQVPESVNAVINCMRKDQWEHSLGNLLDQQYIPRTWDHLESLKSALAAEGPISYEPLTELMQAMSTTQEEYNYGEASIRQVIARIQRSLSLFNSSGMPSVVSLQPAPEPLISNSDMFGSLSWPTTSVRVSPLALYKQESPLSSLEAHQAWINLSETEKDIYRTRYEQLRLVAWQEHELLINQAAELQSTRIRPESVPNATFQELPEVPEVPKTITGLQVFEEELYPNTSFDEVLRQWDALTEMQMDTYNTRAAALMKVAEAEYAVRWRRAQGIMEQIANTTI